jgi:hypothetical protein
MGPFDRKVHDYIGDTAFCSKSSSIIKVFGSIRGEKNEKGIGDLFFVVGIYGFKI